jgi:hypothetical protein
MQIKSIKPHKEISQQPTKSRKIPLGNLITKKVHRARIRKKRQTSFTVNARKKGRSALIKNTLAGNEGNLELHAQPTTLAPSQHTPHQLFYNNHVWDKGQKGRKSH